MQKVKDIILEAGDVALKLFKIRDFSVTKKIDGSYVTDVDIEVDKMLGDALNSYYPDIEIISEEGKKTCISDKYWLIDPIDGTSSFISGSKEFTINIALIHSQKPIMGWIYAPAYGHLYYTDHNQDQTFLVHEIHGKKSPIKQSQEEFSAVISRFKNNKERGLLNSMNVVNFREMSSSLKLCQVAIGEASFYPRFGPSMEWDIAAGHALIKANGGNVVDIFGKELSYGKDGFLNSPFFAGSSFVIKNLNYDYITGVI